MATPEEFAAEKELARQLAEERAAAERRSQIQELRRLTSAENHRQDVLRVIAEHAPLLGVPELEPSLAPVRRKPKHTWMLLLSDWQLGQRNTLKATNQLFEQSSEVTERQVRLLWRKLCRLHDLHRQAKSIETLVIEALGDLMEGDSLRVSQATKIDRLAVEQCIQATSLLEWLIYQALRRFPRVVVDMVGGNHERVSQRAGDAGLGELGYTDTYAFLMGAFLQKLFRRAISSGRLELVNHESWFGARVVEGLKVVFEHGASFRASTGSYAGISYYSIANAASSYQRMLSEADLVLMGHHHRAMVLPLNNGWGWQVMNGALPPASDYSMSRFKGFGRPSQWLLDLHRDYGVTMFEPIYLDHDRMLRPGEFWERIEALASS